MRTDLRRPCTPSHPTKSAPHHPTPRNPHPATAISWGPRDRDFVGTPGSGGPASAVLAHASTDALAPVLGARPPAGAPGHRMPRPHSESLVWSRVPSPPLQLVDSVLQEGQYRLQRLGRPLHAARQVDDQGTAADAGARAGEHSHRCLLESLLPHQLGQSRDLVVEHARGRLRGHVPGGKAGAAGREEQVESLGAGPEPGGDPGAIVRHDVDHSHLEACSLQQLGNRGAALVLHRPGRGPVAHGQDGRLGRVRLCFRHHRSRHGYKDMHVPRAVLFDYGLTLVSFTYPREELLRVLGEVRLWLGPRPPEPAWLMREVLEPLEAGLDSFGEEEVDYMEYYETAWRRAGLEVPRETLWRVLDVEQRCWDRSVRLAPDALQTLAALRGRGLRLGIASNAPFPPGMLHRQLRLNGIAPAVDVAVFSSEIGRRKPSPELYRAALDRLGVEPSEALH